MNEVLKHKIQIINDERIKYEDYYKIFNTLRTVIALAVCPILGMFENFMIISWDSRRTSISTGDFRIGFPGVFHYHIMTSFLTNCHYVFRYFFNRGILVAGQWAIFFRTRKGFLADVSGRCFKFWLFKDNAI